MKQVYQQHQRGTYQRLCTANIIADRTQPAFGPEQTVFSRACAIGGSGWLGDPPPPSPPLVGLL